MNKRETFSLLTLISVYYEQFEIDQEKVDAWHQVLKDTPYAEAEKQLYSHVSQCSHPPKVSDLIRKPYTGARAIPNVDETAYIIYHDFTPASEEVVQEQLAEMRKMLEIKREGDPW